MKLNKDEILYKLLRQYKQGDIEEVELKHLLVELEIMEPGKIIKTKRISQRQINSMSKDAIIIIK